MIRVKTPATSANLGPGFDCFGMAVTMHNIIEVEEIDSGLEIQIPEEDGKYISRNEKNMVYVAMKKVFDRVGYSCKGLKLNLINGIPLARGLGSSAACIAGGMTAANYLAGSPLELQEIINMATEMEGHPDNILPALVGGITVACMEEGRIFYVRIEPNMNLKFAVMVPNFCLSTSASRKLLPKQIPIKDAVFNIGRASLMTASLLNGDIDNLIVATEDKLHQPYRKKLIPHWDEIFQRARELGAKGVFLSGAGPSIIAILEDNNMNFCKEMQHLTTSFHEKWDIKVVDLCRDGATIL